VIFTIYKSTFERGDALNSDYPSPTDVYREHVFDWYKDMGRTLDYIQTRNDLDSTRIAYYGLSWGAALGQIFAVVASRALKPHCSSAAVLTTRKLFPRSIP